MHTDSGATQGDVTSRYISSVNASLLEAGELIEAIKGIVAALDEEAEKYSAPEDYNQMYRLASLLRAVDNIDEDLRELAKLTHKLKEKIANQYLLKAMQRLSPKGFTLGNSKVVIFDRQNASFTNKEQGMAWLRDIGQGAIITETVHPQTLSAFVRGYIEEHGMEPPECVKVSRQQFAKVK